MIILTMLASVTVLPLLAVKGNGYRGVYFALALAAIVFGFVAFSMVGPPSASASETELRGRQVVNAYFPSIGLWLWATAFGAALAGLLWKPRKAA